ncbi:DsrE family protein [Sphingomonas sp.]|uniref:DsrE family protein n=1 Tax=Sphingomonas sp. TaxID=28214 RepID=UPI001ED07BA5|nr:DsrE family protein [Sphingomonas sp.]MBX3593007.1 DsrE family protein [Sphingomonas sp.]
MTRRLTLLAALLATPVAAQTDGFRTGPVFADFGKTAPVQSDLPIPPGTVFKVAFDLSDAAAPGEVNRGLDSVARFINMHAAAGVPLKDIHVAVVVHGKAGFDLANAAAYARKYGGATNASAKLVAQLIDKGADIYLCGQSAAALGIGKDQVLPGVKLSLSAMTAHALLQQRGYTLNPF